MNRSCRTPAVHRLAWLFLLAALRLAAAPSPFIQIRDGYFWDPAANDYFLARGIAYQTFNPEVGATQSPEQIAYDLGEFVRLRANSVRCEFVWSQLQVAPDRWDFTKSDVLVREAERLGLRLFVIIGFQYPPAWFPAEWRGVNDRILTEPDNAKEWRSDVLNYEHPEARQVYSNHLARVTARYRDSPAVAGWILGNEYAYFDLWESVTKYPNRRILGHDPWSLAAFRRYLRERHGDLATLNARWNASFASFDEVPMPGALPGDRRSPAHQDAYQWRKQSVGSFVAIGAQAARANDPNHLTTYSMVGGIFNGLDANYTAEDGQAIVAACRAAGAPLDFWSLNNYAWAALGSEMRSGDFGIAKYQAQAGLPVMISETGFSSTEDTFDKPLAALRQPAALPGALWEAYMSGAIGWHVFTWPDRPRYGEGFFLRERGFGVVQPDRQPKTNVFENLRRVFLQLHNLRAERLLGGSSNPPPDVQFLWSEDGEIGWPVANQENAMLWGALKRAGYQPGLLDDAQFQAGAWSNAPVLLLSRAFQLRPEYLDILRTQVAARGIHLHANADLPGQFDAWSRPNTNWLPFLREVFGVDAAGAATWLDLWATNAGGMNLTLSQTAAGLPAGSFNTWKAWRGLVATPGTTVAARFVPEGQGGTPQPALFQRSGGLARRALNAFALGDSFAGTSAKEGSWDFRTAFIRHIYGGYFRLPQAIPVSATPAHVFVDHRPVRGGGVLVSLLNGGTNTASATVDTTGRLAGLVLEDLLNGGLLTPTNGALELTLAGDEFRLLYAYRGDAASHRSIITPSPAKIWFVDAPGGVLAGGPPVTVRTGLETTVPGAQLQVSLEQLAPRRRTIATSAPVAPSPEGEAASVLAIPAWTVTDPDWRPTEDGAAYQWHATLVAAGAPLASVTSPVRLERGIWPGTPLPDPVPRATLSVPIVWGGLPDGTGPGALPLDRRQWWDSVGWGGRQYRLLVEVLRNGQTVASAQHFTPNGAGRHTLQLQMPANPGSPLAWRLTAQLPTNLVSHDLFDSFEGRPAGALYSRLTNDPSALSPILPWFSYQYPSPGPWQWWDEGVDNMSGTHGSQSGFQILTNFAGASGTGFGLKRQFTAAWALPAAPADWSRYSFSFDFREASGHPAVIEMQVANADVPGQQPRLISFSRTYAPGTNGWDRISARLDQFAKPSWSPGFNPAAVLYLVCNVQMRRDGAVYHAFFDNIRFDGPDSFSGTPAMLSEYSSRVTLAADADADGLPDSAEDGSGVWGGESRTGTRPDRADSDGDGVPDGAEAEAGTDPNRADDAPGFSSAMLAPDGAVELRWRAAPGRAYVLETRDTSAAGEAFVPLEAAGEFFSIAGGEQVARISPADAAAFYRLAVRRP
ncbi:MAG: beta-galactosidase [Limisphaerales bacterium]